MPEAIQHFVMGLPGAGKTTFLAALWHVVESGEVDGSLILDKLHGDQAYLHSIRTAWADSNEIERTKIAHEQYVCMRLRLPGEESATELVFPDLSGESFRGQWRDRQMDAKYASLLSVAEGGLLFVHPKKVHTETLIPEVNQMLERMAVGIEQDAETDANNDTSSANMGDVVKQDKWIAEKSPTQVQLVDLLQFALAKTQSSETAIKLGVVISAWDCVQDSQVSPASWVEQNLPLLWQFLKASDQIEEKYFGISAQGAELEDAETIRDDSLASGKCSDRIRVVNEDLNESHDVTEPVRWLIGATES